jgi:hypothetical protein
MGQSDYMNTISTFDWFVGEVEDIMDPLKLGRVRVRCVGIHNIDKRKLPTKDLPWAHLIMPVNSTTLDGVGVSPTGMAKGTTVVGFFKDGKNSQEPVIMGTIGGIAPPKKYDSSGEVHDTNRLARNEELGKTIVNNKVLNQMEESMILPMVSGSSRVYRYEPEVPYKAKYPFNNVIEFKSGHVIEVDDTEDAERLHIYHKSGTMHEVHPDGKQVSRIEGERYTVVAGEDNLHVKGNCNITVGDHLNIGVDDGRVIIYAGENTHIITGGDTKIGTQGNTTITSGTGSKIHMDGSNIFLNADGVIRLDASAIHLNG